MEIELDTLREALTKCDRSRIARMSGVTYRTIDNIIHQRNSPHRATRDALIRALRRAKQLTPEQAA